MKKNTKVVLTALALLASTATTPAVALADTATITASETPALIAANPTAAKTNSQSVSMLLTKTGTTTPSESAMFLGKSADVTVENGKVTQVTIHVSGNTPMSKGQDMSKMMTSMTLNGVEGKQANVAKDGSSLDFVFAGEAYKEGKGTIKFTINLGPKSMQEAADVTLGAVATTPAKTTDTTTTTDTKKPAKTTKAVKRTLKHNAYVYNKAGKRVNKKALKKGKKVSTYGKAVKLKGKAFYQIGKNSYVKKANF
ncbi:surface layer protein [Lactobacillus pasteurii DSM 23907 = CRBIP 24.76]|uniref:S-layer protein n=1 Tax=Lactobacillus pasteurii DSM 23907 = CRBIP 24.76 TaxID=1423790 RepID=I7LAN9_9LACO|nr:SLAP domain-containing protein [Lactobacillus pasteurii]KRK08217.1 surface layer protein [Lactobacillus pasteurii DSM 23907 = CRBIP 24.76]TDG77336.1 hypothetical protein C5L33_000779 [Lactobacillus pasteurii]CCI84881.1 S-layer protein [Lactobacillus pasteurii DSM 23907 = CRBIP 24.76]